MSSGTVLQIVLVMSQAFTLPLTPDDFHATTIALLLLYRVINRPLPGQISLHFFPSEVSGRPLVQLYEHGIKGTVLR